MNLDTYYIGLLGNVDSSVIDLDLGHGFVIKEKSYKEFKEIISTLNDGHYASESAEVIKKLFPWWMYHNIIDENPVQFIYGDLKNLHDIPRKDGSEPTYTGDGEYIYEVPEFESSYVEPVLRLMRLYKEGNPKVLGYIESRDDVLFYSASSKKRIEPNIFSIGKDETKNVEEFIQNINFPFNRPYLQLAFDNFELSYNVNNQMLSFISLMISIEALFHPSSQGELRQTISRNVAVLLGKDKEEASIIYKNMKQLYTKRSKIVHTGQSKDIDGDDLLLLGHYVRESIKEIMIINEDKDKYLLPLLNKIGFGDYKRQSSSIKIAKQDED